TLKRGELTMVATEPHATLRYAAVSCRAQRGWLAREAGPPAPPEPRLLGGRPQPGGPDVPSVIRPVAFAPRSAKIRSVRAQPIQTSPAHAYRAEGARSKRRRAETQGAHDAGIRCNLSQRLRCYADLPILQPNSS